MVNKLVQITIYVCFIVATAGCTKFALKDPGVTQNTVRVNITQYCPEGTNSFNNVFALNLSAYNTIDGLVYDTDRDGLSDQYEQSSFALSQHAFGSRTSDSYPVATPDNYSDLFVYNMGYDVDQQDALRVCDVVNDTDLDLLNDCEEDLVGTDRLNADTDADGIPDGIEFRYGLNPIDPLDALKDVDGDSVTNIDEIKKFTLLQTSKVFQKLQLEQKYEIKTIYNEATFQTCYDITISDIPLVTVSNGNQIKIILQDVVTVPGQGQTKSLRDVTIIASRALPNGYLITIDDVQNQTITVGL